MVTGGAAVVPGGAQAALASPQGSPHGSPQGQCVPQDSMPQRRSAENRRSNKPIMEKRRRARINNCLNELKTLILDAMKKDPARHSKLEKADILEMTVKHLENMQRQQVALATATDPAVINKFRAGFSECAGEVGRFPGLEPAVRRRLLQHLSACLGGANTAGAEPGPQSPPPATAGTAPNPAQALQLHILPAEAGSGATTPINAAVTGNGNGIFFSTGANGAGLQLVPTRLPNGDIALVLPSSRAGQFGQVPAGQVPAGPHSPQDTVIKSSPPSSPSPAHSPSPLPMLIPIPQRTASTGSATSSASSSSFVSTSTSPVAFDRLSVNSPPSLHPAQQQQQQQPAACPASPSCPSSPLSSSSCSYDMKPYLPYGRPYSPEGPEDQKPLALVTKKKYEMEVDEEQPWRPW